MKFKLVSEADEDLDIIYFSIIIADFNIDAMNLGITNITDFNIDVRNLDIKDHLTSATWNTIYLDIDSDNRDVLLRNRCPWSLRILKNMKLFACVEIYNLEWIGSKI